MKTFSKRQDKGCFESEALGLELMSIALSSHQPSLIRVPRVVYARDDVGLDIELIEGLKSGFQHDSLTLARGLRVVHDWIPSLDQLQDLTKMRRSDDVQRREAAVEPKRYLHSSDESHWPSRRQDEEDWIPLDKLKPWESGPITFGFPLAGQCGDLEHPNNQEHRMMTWLEFFRDFRLSHQSRVLKQRYPDLGRIHELIQKLLKHLDELFKGVIVEDIRPRLLHGDVWNGNWSVDSKGNVWMFDPAPFFGDFEFDFGIGSLFGGPTSKSFIESYFEGHAQRPGFGERVLLYALYHNLNHLNMFGTSYASASERMLRELTSKKVIGVL